MWKRKADIDNLQVPLEPVLTKRLRVCYTEAKEKMKGKNVKALVPKLLTERTVKAIYLVIDNR